MLNSSVVKRLLRLGISQFQDFQFQDSRVHLFPVSPAPPAPPVPPVPPAPPASPASPVTPGSLELPGHDESVSTLIHIIYAFFWDIFINHILHSFQYYNSLWQNRSTLISYTEVLSKTSDIFTNWAQQIQTLWLLQLNVLLSYVPNGVPNRKNYKIVDTNTWNREE